MLKRMELSGGKVVPNGDNGNIHVYVNPDETERKYLVEKLELDEHTLASALDPDELARLEFEPNHTALIFKRPRNYSSEDMFVFKIASVGLFLFENRLIVVLSEDIPLFQGKQFARITSLQEVALKIIYSSIAHFNEHLRVINAVSDALEDQINASMENKYLLSLFSLEKSLVYYLNGIGSNGKLIERVKNSAVKLKLTTESIEFVDDMIIENQQCYEQASTYSNILASMMDARVSIVSNNLNWLIKTLTIITIAIMLPTLVVSVFSMNVEIPLEDHPYAFWVILAMALSTTYVVRLVWRWKKW
ncbi:MAG: magnesium transporter CorA family protein [Pirellulales bacterium]|nr:magnesium transporter CorA family protein [Pirellulales bacterium]